MFFAIFGPSVDASVFSSPDCDPTTGNFSSQARATSTLPQPGPSDASDSTPLPRPSMAAITLVVSGMMFLIVSFADLRPAKMDVTVWLSWFSSAKPYRYPSDFGIWFSRFFRSLTKWRAPWPLLAAPWPLSIVTILVAACICIAHLGPVSEFRSTLSWLSDTPLGSIPSRCQQHVPCRRASVAPAMAADPGADISTSTV